MDPVSISLLVTGAWKLLEPFAKKAGSKLLDKATEILPDATGKLWDMIKSKMESKPETASLPADLAKKPDDTMVQGAFQYQLTKLLENDEAFADQLDVLLKQAKIEANTTQNATLIGNGAIAQGDNARAVGARGVMIEGGVHGSHIITGDNDSVNDEKKKK